MTSLGAEGYFALPLSMPTALLKTHNNVGSKIYIHHNLFEFSKTFDCDYHPLSPFKLKKTGFFSSCMNWVKANLAGR